MLRNLKRNFIEALITILPVVVLVMVMTLITPMPVDLLISFLFSSLLLVVGTGLFTFGSDISMITIGEKIGNKLIKSKKMWFILVVSLIIGTVVTIAEPDLRVLADQLTSVPSELLIIIISLGVGIYMLLSSLRSLCRLDLNSMLIISFLIIFLLLPFVPSDFIPVAFDSGGVTTGTISIPFIMMLGAGLVANRTDEKAKESSFGLVALCSTGPILMVMLLGLVYKPDSAFNVNELLNNNFGLSLYISEFWNSFKDVLFSISPIILVFAIYQLFTKEVSKFEMRKIIFGIIIVILGLTCFLTAANSGFMDMGYFLGEHITNSSYKYLLVPITMILAFFIAIAEPAVKVLVEQVEELTGGSISKSIMEWSLAIGVSIASGLSIYRIFNGTSFLTYAIPSYALCLILMFFVPKTFTAVAFDAGGAAGGTLTATFLLPIAIGACIALDANILTEAFGLAALASVVPIITVQIIGLVYQLKNRTATEIEGLDDAIIDYDWEVVNG